MPEHAVEQDKGTQSLRCHRHAPGRGGEDGDKEKPQCAAARAQSEMGQQADGQRYRALVGQKKHPGSGSQSDSVLGKTGCEDIRS